MIRFLSLLLFFWLLASSLFAHDPNKNHPITPNRGQWGRTITHKVELTNGVVLLQPDGWMYVLNKYQENVLSTRNAPQTPKDPHAKIVGGHAVKVKLKDANLLAFSEEKGKSEAYFNYFLGKDPARWVSGIHKIERVSKQQVYPGIDLSFYPENGSLKYDWIVAAGADPAKISWNYEGQDAAFLRAGHLVLATSTGEIIEHKPYAYQLINGQKTEVACQYFHNGEEWSFAFPEGFDPGHELVIDPELVFSTFSGSFSDNWGFTATYDELGNVYAGGIVFNNGIDNNGFPVSPGAFQSEFQGGDTDVSLMKYSIDGNILLYGTYLGGFGNELPFTTLVNSQGQLIIMGVTGSADFPVTSNAFQQNFLGGNNIFYTFSMPNGTDIFVSVLSSNGRNLIGSTYLGGSEIDGLNIGLFGEAVLDTQYGDQHRSDIIVDENDNILLVSQTHSLDFPMENALNPAPFGQQDVVLAKLNNNVSDLLWSTYFGGSEQDAGYSIKINSEGNVVFCGGTRSSDLSLPAGVNALNSSYIGGFSDGYIATLNDDGSAVLFGTYVGTTAQDQAMLFGLDENDNPHIFGTTNGNYPVTPGVYNNPNSGQFIHKLNPSLNQTEFSTVFGSGSGSPQIRPTALTVDGCGNMHLAGWGNTTGFPTTADAYQSTTDGADFYLMSLTFGATELIFGSFFGSTDGFPGGIDDHVDGGTSRFSQDGVIYQSVCTCSGEADDFPTTPGVYSSTNNNRCNIGTFKFDLEVLQTRYTPSKQTGCAPVTIDFENTSIGATEWNWKLWDNSTPDSLNNVDGNGTATNKFSHTFTQPGEYIVQLEADGRYSCRTEVFTDTIRIYSETPMQLPVDFISGCQGEEFSITAPAGFVRYEWSDGKLGRTRTFSSSGTYTLEAYNEGNCISTDQVTVEITPLPEIDLGADVSFCEGGSVQIGFDLQEVGISYSWSTGATSPLITANTPGTYTVTTERNGCTSSDEIVVTETPLPVINLPETVTICENDFFTANATVTGSATYQWSGPVTSNQPSIQVNQAGTYTVTVTRNGCSSSKSFALLVDPLPALDLGQDLRICEGESITLDATVSGNASYVWENTSNEPVRTITQSGTYSVTVTRGECTVTDEVSIIVDEAFEVNLGEDAILCEGEVLTLNASISGSATYLWEDGSTQASRNITQSGMYFVAVTRGACVSRDTLTATFLPLPEVELGENISICEGETRQLDASVSGDNVSYLWNTGETTPQISVSSSGTFSVEVTRDGCVSGDQLTLSVVPLPTVELGENQTVCNGETVTLSPTISGNFDQIRWFSAALPTDQFGETLNVTVAGKYYVEVINNLSLNCGTLDSVEVFFDEAFEIDLGPNLLACNGDITTFNAFVEGASYQWKREGSETVLSTEAQLSVTESGTFNVVVSRGACTRTGSVSVQYQAPPVVDLGPDQTLCEGETATLVSTISTSNYVHTWSTGGGNVNQIQVTESGVYWLEVTNNVCTVRDSVVITFDPAFEIELGPDITVCASEAVPLSSVVPNADAYRWEKDGQQISTSEEIIITADGGIFGPGTYQLTVQRGVCERTDDITVDFFPLPAPVEILGTPSVCPGVVGVIYEVLPTEGYTYHWEARGVNAQITNGQGSALITVDWPTSDLEAEIRLVQENEFGCVNDTLVYPVEVFNQLKTETPNGLTEVCANKTEGNAYEIRPTSGSAYNWRIEGGEVVTGQGSAQITVNWDGLGLKKLWIEEEVNTVVSTCFGTSDTLFVTVFQDSARLEMRNVSVSRSQPNSALINWAVENENRVYSEGITLERKAASSPNWSLIGSFPVVENQAVDENADLPDEPWQYRVTSENLCGVPIESGLHQTVFLSGSNTEADQTIELTWTAYIGWEVAAYEIHRSVDGSPFSFVATFPPDQLSALLTDGLLGFEHTLVIKAVSADGNRESWSNEVMFTFEHLIDLVPNVFTPNGDQYNQTFIIPKIQLYPENELVVVNRWGKEVYRKKNYQNEWDGSNVTSGVYYYQFRTSLKSQVMKGVIHVMK